MDSKCLDVCVAGRPEAAPAAPDLLPMLQHSIFDQAPGFIAVLQGPEHVFAFVNRAYVTLAGERDYVGRPVRAVLPEIEGQGYFELLDQVYRTGERYTASHVPVLLARAAGAPPEQRFVDFIYAPIRDEDGLTMGIFVEGHDVTHAYSSHRALEATQRRQALLIELSDRIRDLEEPAEISYAAAELLGRALNVSRAGYGTINVADETITIDRDWNAPGIQSLAGTLHFRDYGSYIEDLKRGETVVFADAEEDPRTAATAAALKAISAQAVVNMPVTEQGGFVALLYLNHERARQWTDDELALIREVAERTRTAVERRRAERDSRELTERLRLAQRVASAVTWEHDLRAGLTYWSDPKATRDLVGVELQSPASTNEWIRHIHPEDRAAYFQQWNASLPAGEGHVLVRMLRGGELRWLEAFGRVTERDDAGQPLRVVGISMDVTERRGAELARAESEARLRLAVEAGRMAVWEHDPVAGTITSSPELNRILGYPEDAELDLADLRSRYYPGEQERLAAIGARALQNGERFIDAEYRFYRPDGDLRWFLIRAEIVLDEARNPIRTVGVLLDITDRKTAEESLREREADLKAALDAGALAIFDFDHLAGRMRPSPRLAELYGFPPGHTLTLADIRSRYHPDDAAEIVAQAVSDLADLQKQNFRWELRLLLPDGTVRWVEGLGEYVRDQEGRVLRSRGVVLDVTERKRWEQQQRLLINELNHRVKNTLAIVQGLARTSYRRGEDAGAAREVFEARIQSLSAAHDLLTRRSWESAEISQVVTSATDAALGPAAARVHTSGPELLLPPQTAVSVALAVHELCTNALKYGALSAQAGRVEVRWTATDPKGEPRLQMSWSERGGPRVDPPKSRGFGTRMIERGLANELNGTVRLDFEPEGLSCWIDAPLPALPGPAV
ncbi:PAS domain-containing protein [Phenylobacterium sp.]|jgi:PAS domain S-box-containing protein|uniref:PAS domain-containing protein n=1 Tax=Phenylobacterium sp. TaxID=1871053 RepID=UPI002F9523AE